MPPNARQPKYATFAEFCDALYPNEKNDKRNEEQLASLATLNNPPQLPWADNDTIQQQSDLALARVQRVEKWRNDVQKATNSSRISQGSRERGWITLGDMMIPQNIGRAHPNNGSTVVASNLLYANRQSGMRDLFTYPDELSQYAYEPIAGRANGALGSLDASHAMDYPVYTQTNYADAPEPASSFVDHQAAQVYRDPTRRAWCFKCCAIPADGIICPHGVVGYMTPPNQV